MKPPAMLAGVAAGLLLSGLALAQNPAAPPSQRPVAQPASGATTMSRHTMTGEVTRVNPEKGWLFIKTAEGRMLLHFPSSALQSVKEGDNVTIELALKDNGPAPSTK
jgi:cold shock CspA family protein